MKRTLALTVTALLAAASCTSGDEVTESSEPPAAEELAAEEPTEEPAAEEPAAEDPAAEEPAAEEPAAEEPAAEEPATEEPATDTQPEFVDQTLEGPAPGVTDDTIRIGITYIDLGSVESVALTHGDYEAAYRAFVDDVNANGGINGRMLEPVIRPIRLGDGDNADAVCLELTEDEDVFVVMGFFLGDAPACYLELHSKAIIGGTMNADLLSRARAPWFSNEGTDFEGDAVAKLVESGLLDGTFAVSGSSLTETIIDSTILPALDAAGRTPVEVAINDAPADDLAAADALAATILQRFETLGVDTVLAASVDGLGVAQALETSAYRPRIVSTNAGTLYGFAEDDGRDLSVLEGAVAAGLYGPDAAVFSEPDMVHCIEVYEAAGNTFVHPDEYQEGDDRNWVSMSAACGYISLFRVLADYAGPNLNYATFQEAGYTIGDVKWPGNPVPYFFGPPPHADGDVPVFLYAWDSDAGEFVIQ